MSVVRYYRCRCRACNRRQRLRKHPDEYRVAPRCPYCGKQRVHVDRYRNSGDEQKSKTCRPDKTGCQGYSFPHAHGRGYCDFNPRLTAEILQDRYESGRWS